MKKFSLICLALLCLILCSCGEKAEKKVVNVYSWGEYISDGSEDSLDSNAAFEQYYFEKYGEEIEVVYTTYASNEDMYAKLKSGASGYDVIVPSDYMIERLIKEGMLQPIDFSNVPNYANIGDDFKNLYYDPENLYSVPYTYGMVGVIYNPNFVEEADAASESWDLMWNEKYAGRILQFNNSRDAFGTAMYKLGISVNDATEEEWRVALEELKKQQPHVQSYVMDEIYNKMESGEAAISAYYAGDYLSMLDNNDELLFYYPKADGKIRTNLFVDAYCIPKDAPNKTLAEEYINYMLSEEPAIANAEYIYYASPNKAVYENEEYIEYMGEDMEVLYPEGFSFKENYNAMSYHNLDADTLMLVNKLWEELKISSATGETVYVLAVVIIVGLVGYAVFHTLRKRKRAKYY